MTLSEGEGGSAGTRLGEGSVSSSREENDRVEEWVIRVRGGLVSGFEVISESSSWIKTSVAAGAILECFGDLDVRLVSGEDD